MKNENNTILKLSRKQKKSVTSRQLKVENQIQTQLGESQRINLKEGTTSEKMAQPISNEITAPTKLEPNLPNLNEMKEIIYDNKFGDPVVESINVNDLGKSNAEDGEAPADKMLEDVGMYPALVKCPYCNTQIKSNVSYSCNCFTVFVLIVMIIIFPLILIASIYNAGSNKKCCHCKSGDRCGICDCCNDAQHFCPKCGKLIGESYSCERLFSCI